MRLNQTHGRTGLATLALAMLFSARALADDTTSVVQLVADGIRQAETRPRGEYRSSLLVRTAQGVGTDGRSYGATVNVRIARGPAPRMVVRGGEPAPEVTIAVAEVKQGQAVGTPVLLVRLERKGSGVARGNLLATLVGPDGKARRVGAMLTASAGADGAETLEMPLYLPGQGPVDLSQIRLAYLPHVAKGEGTATALTAVAVR